MVPPEIISAGSAIRGDKPMRITAIVMTEKERLISASGCPRHRVANHRPDEQWLRFTLRIRAGNVNAGSMKQVNANCSRLNGGRRHQDAIGQGASIRLNAERLYKG
jgi:hypothetical protein